MELYYKTTRLKELCENPKYSKKLIQRYGLDIAKKLPQRINELKAFATLEDVPSSPPLRRHKLVGNLDGSFAININNQYRLIFRPYGNNIIIDDLRLIKNIEIMEVSKHYE